MNTVADVLRLRYILQSDPDIPADGFSLWAINAADALVTTLRHKFFSPLLGIKFSVGKEKGSGAYRGDMLKFNNGHYCLAMSILPKRAIGV